jgi:hypothetical protein
MAFDRGETVVAHRAGHWYSAAHGPAAKPMPQPNRAQG